MITDGRPEPVSIPASERVFSLILAQGPISRVAIARRTGLSQAAVTKLAKPLLAAGYLEETADRERTGPGAGRPASPLQIRADREFFVGIKLTEYHLIGVLADLRADVRARLTWDLTGRDPAGTVTQLAAMVDWLRRAEPTFHDRSSSLAVAMSGDVDRRRGLVGYSPFLDWHDVPLAAMIGEATGMSVTIENDVKALTVGEQWYGAGAGAADFAVVTLGQGIGSALVLGERLHSGAYGVAGELGHTPVGGDEPPCPCGGRGCVEAIASSEVLTAEVRRATGDPSLGFPNAVRLADSGDPIAKPIFDRAAAAIGRAVATLANLTGPERIVIAADNPDLAGYRGFHDEVRRSYAEQAFGSAGHSDLVFVHRPLDAWARAAAAIALQARLAR